MKVISILGLAGTDRDNNPIKSIYKNETSLSIIEGDYLNSTDVLISNLNADFFLIGSKEAIEKQKKLLSINDTSTQWIEFDKDDLSDIFKLVLDLTENQNDEFLIDVTHGLRHQPIMAAFAAFTRTVLSKQKIKLLFASEAQSEHNERYYRYVFLDDYIDHAAASFTLSSFVKTLSAPSDVYSDPLIDALYRFSRELFSNHLSALFLTALPELEIALKRAMVSQKLSFLESVIEEALNIVNDFKTAKAHPHLYQTYLDLSMIMFRFNYPLLCATYLYEGIQLYYYHHFKRLDIVQLDPDYDTLNTIKAYVKNAAASPDLHLPHEYFYCSNFHLFAPLNTTFEKIRMIRNNTAHLNLKYTHEDLFSELSEAIHSCFDLCIEKDIFAALSSVARYESEECRKDKGIFIKHNADFFSYHFGFLLSRSDPDKHISRLQLLKEQNFDALSVNKLVRDKLIEALRTSNLNAIIDSSLKLQHGNNDTIEHKILMDAFKHRYAD